MKKANIVCVALSCVFVLSGCGSSVLDLTKEESNMVSEYAAELLLKYDKNYVSRIVDTTAYHEELERIAEEERKAAEAAAAEQARLEAEAAAEAAALEEANSSNVSQATVQIVSSIEEFYQLQGVSIRYGGYGVYDSYPEQTEGEDLFFSLDATAGNRFLVLYFDVSNVSGADMEFNMIDLSPKFRVSVNGSANKVPMLCSLPEELLTYKGWIGAGETIRTVVVTEIPTQDTEWVNTITLTLRGNAGSAQLPLQ